MQHKKLLMNSEYWGDVEIVAASIVNDVVYSAAIGGLVS